MALGLEKGGILEEECMIQRVLRYVMLGAAVVVLTACGGGSNDYAAIQKVKLDINDLNIKGLSEYTLVNSSSKTRADNTSRLDIEKNKRDIVVLMDKGGEPILMGRKFSGDTDVVVSLASSAEIFVLYHPRFNGVSVKDPKKLSNAIRSNKKFPQLMKAIKKAINNDNPSPMNPTCNFEARDIAIEIANDLNIDELYKK